MSAHPFDDPVLDEHLAAALEDPETAHDSGLMEIDSMERANRVMWRIGQLHQQRAGIKRTANVERAAIDVWEAAETGRIDKALAFLGSLAARYHQRLLAKDKRRRTVNLPTGTLKVRKSRDTWAYHDEAQFLAWAAEHRPELVRTKTEPEKADAKKALRLAVDKPQPGDEVNVIDPKTGEVVPGLTVIYGHDEHSVAPHNPQEGTDG